MIYVLTRLVKTIAPITNNVIGLIYSNITYIFGRIA